MLLAGCYKTREHAKAWILGSDWLLYETQAPYIIYFFRNEKYILYLIINFVYEKNKYRQVYVMPMAII